MTTTGPITCKAYKPSVATESNKLASKETDWNLPGYMKDNMVLSRTRGAGNGRPDYCNRKKQFIEMLTESFDDESVEDSEDCIAVDGLTDLEGGAPVEEEELEGKHASTRAIVDLAAMMETLHLHCRCPECNGPLQAEVKHLCIASKWQLTYPSSKCGYIHYSKPPGEANV
jgi:hypothetical protein